MNYKNHTIRHSGKEFLRVYDPAGNGLTPRTKTIDAAKALIDCLTEHRVMTPEEHRLIHPQQLVY